eukprot:264526-Hanusia_phi.AAC.1
MGRAPAVTAGPCRSAGRCGPVTDRTVPYGAAGGKLCLGLCHRYHTALLAQCRCGPRAVPASSPEALFTSPMFYDYLSLY